jgi:hypothetical protein
MAPDSAGLSFMGVVTKAIDLPLPAVSGAALTGEATPIHINVP